jgi:hypothetical protein
LTRHEHGGARPHRRTISTHGSSLSSGTFIRWSNPEQGAVETDSLTPVGEYANACVARERVFEFFAEERNGHRLPSIELRG